MNKTKFLIIGGDNRQSELFTLLKARGDSCKIITDSDDEISLAHEIQGSNAVILPVPMTKDRRTVYSAFGGGIALDTVLGALTSSHKLVAGGIDPDTCALLKKKNVSFHDLLLSESFAVYNAYLTAQGALRLVLENSDEYIIKKRFLITGFGRVGKACAVLLKNLGCDVYVAARKKAALSEAFSMGCKTLSINELKGKLFLFDYILGTVPSRIFDEDDIASIQGVYIELASAPYGGYKAHFELHTKRYVFAPSLPGQFTPLSCAKAILCEIDEFLIE